MKSTIFATALLFYLSTLQEAKYQIETSDISNFWEAYDLLITAKSRQDSVAIFQKYYIDKASVGFKEFIRIRKFTANEYIEKISLYPKFWESVRPLTENIETRKAEIRNVFAQLSSKLPNYKQPNVCFAMGCLRTGGTISGNLILIGSEIAAANSEVDKSELPPWLKNVVGNTGDIASMIAHETIHTQQIDSRFMIMKNNVLLEQTLKEGIADFLTWQILGLNINAELHKYGNANQYALWQDFKSDLESNPNDYSGWLYNYRNTEKRPADLGYYIGFKIAEAYYKKQSDKGKAIETLLNQKNYKKIFKESEYNGKTETEY